MHDGLDPYLSLGLGRVACGLDGDGRDAKSPHHWSLPDVQVRDPIVRDDSGPAEDDPPFPAHLVLMEFVPHALVVEFGPEGEQDDYHHHASDDTEKYPGIDC